MHADVKAANILTGFHAGTEVMNEVTQCNFIFLFMGEIEDACQKNNDKRIEYTQHGFA